MCTAASRPSAAKGVKPGLVFNPAEPLDVLDWVIDDIDLILIMSVNPGFGGQSFIDSALRKIEAVRKRIDASGKDIRLEVDGGIKADNIRRVADAGADTFVAGSAIFGKPDYKSVIDAMRGRSQIELRGLCSPRFRSGAEPAPHRAGVQRGS
jgi:ribulose-phosphate 3-epimerase